MATSIAQAWKPFTQNNPSVTSCRKGECTGPEVFINKDMKDVSPPHKHGKDVRPYPLYSSPTRGTHRKVMTSRDKFLHRTNP